MKFKPFNLNWLLLVLLVSLFSIFVWNQSINKKEMAYLCEKELEIPMRNLLSMEGVKSDSETYTWQVKFSPPNNFPHYVFVKEIEPSFIDWEPSLIKLEGEALIFSTEESVSPMLNIGGVSISTSNLSLDQLTKVIDGMYPVIGSSTVVQVGTDSLDRITHNLDDGTENAIDISAPLGSNVIAFKGGTVVRVESRFHDLGCNDPKFNSRSNLVIILQDDGLESAYGHLMHDSITVEEGDVVETGQLIAKVGNSGAADLTHLHFQLGGITSKGLRSVPIKFHMKDSNELWSPTVGETISNE